ncbi:MAG: adenylyltransferase/cytidyltransferase family protein [Bacteroidia bacterium]
MKIGFACGVFDLFHAGHVLMLKESKNNCDYLIVALNKAENISKEINPGKKPPIFSIEERVLIMEACKYVDEVIVYNSEEELLEILKVKKVNIRFLGEDYRGKKITGSDLDIEIYYTDRRHGLSTSLYRSRLKL